MYVYVHSASQNFLILIISLIYRVFSPLEITLLVHAIRILWYWLPHSPSFILSSLIYRVLAFSCFTLG